MSEAVRAGLKEALRLAEAKTDNEASRKLEGVFANLKAWLKRVYEAAKGIGIEPSREVSPWSLTVCWPRTEPCKTGG
jgi:hypothetical protein